MQVSTSQVLQTKRLNCIFTSILKSLSNCELEEKSSAWYVKYITYACIYTIVFKATGQEVSDYDTQVRVT